MKQADFLSLFSGLSSSMRRVVAVTASSLVLTVALVFLVLMKQVTATRALREEHKTAELALEQTYKNISAVRELRESVDAAERRLEMFKTTAVLEPLQGSYEMRAWQQVAPLAAAAGVDLLRDSPRCTVRLPILLGESISGPFYTRQVVEFSGSGAYTQIVAFVQSVETNLPMVSVSSLRILGQRTPEIHAMQVAFEWPVLSENTAALAKEKKK